MSETPWLDRLRAELVEADITDTQVHFRALGYFSARRNVPTDQRAVHDRRALWALGPLGYLRLRRIFRRYARLYQEQGLV